MTATGKAESKCSVIIEGLQHPIYHHQCLGRSNIKGEIGHVVVLFDDGMHLTCSEIHAISACALDFYREGIVDQTAELRVADGDALHAKTNAYVLGPDQYLYAVSDLPDTQTMKALRAYFVLNFPETTSGSPKRLAKVVFNENETETTTDIEDLQTDIECTKVIVNGQLQIIRDGKTYNAFGQLVK